jgi:hypothetical protein
MQSKKDKKLIGQKPLLDPYKEAELEKRPKGMPPLSEIKTECVRKGLTETDAADLYNHWLMNGFRTGRGPVKSWKAAIHVWKANGWFPSQKRGGIKLHDAVQERDETSFKRIKKEQERNGNRG